MDQWMGRRYSLGGLSNVLVVPDQGSCTEACFCSTHHKMMVGMWPFCSELPPGALVCSYFQSFIVHLYSVA